ncbi:MAG: radical SAM protein [Methylophilaceae bacterium]
MATLTIHDHRRDSAGYTYVYPVISRRAGGVSVGINLNPNNACNWACIYCQVPNLVRGAAPKINLQQLQSELRGFLSDAVNGDWLAQNAPECTMQDIAFSGNGEPTSAAEFPTVVEIVGQVLREFGLLQKLKIRLITNGSLISHQPVQQALASMAAMQGEVWFKLDRATAGGMTQINQVSENIAAVKRRLIASANHCPTWLQTCWFALDAAPPEPQEVAAYLAFVREMREHIQGIHLYGLARPPMQPGAERLSALPAETLEAYAEQMRDCGVTVTVNP